MRVWTVSLPALLTANYPWLSTMNWRPPLTGLASSLAICHAVKFLAPLKACAKMAILTTAIYSPIPPTKSVPCPETPHRLRAVSQQAFICECKVCALILLQNHAVYHPRKQFVDQDK